MKKEFKVEGLQKGRYNPKRYGGMCSRETVLFKEEQKFDFEKGLDTIATTDAPAIVVDWDRWEYVREVLPMRYAELPDDDYAPFLDAHSRVSIEKVLGSAKNWNTTEHELLCKTFVSEEEQKLRNNIKARHVRKVSLGYKTDPDFTVEIPKGASVTIDGVEYRNEYNDGYPFLVRTWFKVSEESAVPIGADAIAQFKSELQVNLNLFDDPGKGIKASDPALQKKLDDALDKIDKQETEINNINIKLKEKDMPEEKEKSAEEIRKDERDRVEGIKAVTEMLVVQKLYKGGTDELDKKVGEAINGDWTVGEFQKHCYDNLKNEDIVLKPVTDLDMSKKEISKLSISRALNAMVEVRGGNPNAWDEFKAGAEKEAINEATKRVGKIDGYKLKGMPLPLDFFKNPDVMRHSNVLKAAYKNHVKDFGEKFGVKASDGLTTTDMTNIIATEVWATEFIDVLRNLGVAGPWGVRMISGAQGNPTVPKKTSTGTFHWTAERGTGTATDFVIGQLTATPKSGWSSMTYGRQANIQSIPALDALVIDDILNNVITGRDLALLHGTGSSNQPTGITAASGIGDVVGASLDWEAIVEFWTDVQTNNVNSNTLRFVMNALVAGLTMTRQVVSGQAQMLWDRIGQISAPPIISQQAAASNLIYGDGAEAWMIDWGLIDLQVNPFLDTTGDVTITAFTLLDILISRVKAFSVSDDIS